MVRSPPLGLHVRGVLRKSFRRLGHLKTVKALAALNITTLAFAAWTVWIYVSYGRTQQRLSTQQLELAVSEASQRRIRISDDLDVGLSGQMYEGDFQLKIENISPRRVEISWVVFEWYLGELKNPPRNNEALEINAPPKRERRIAEAGPLDWVFQGRHGFLLRDSDQIDYHAFAAKPYFEKGGGPTKSLAPGDYAEYTMPLLVRAVPDRWLGVAAVFGIDGGKSRENIFWVSKWFPLRSATDEQSSKEGK